MAKTDSQSTADNRSAGAESQSSSNEQEKKRGRFGCCLGRLVVLFLLLGGIIAGCWVGWRYYHHGKLKEKLADYGAKGEVFGAQHLNELYQSAESSQDATNALSSACDTANSSEFLEEVSHYPFFGEGEVPAVGEEWVYQDEASEILSRYEDAVVQLRRFGELGGNALIPLDFAVDRGLDPVSIAMLDNGMNLLMLDALVQIGNEDLEALAADIRAALVFSNSIKTIPARDQYLRLDYDQRAMELLEFAIKRISFEEKQLAEFEALISEREYLAGLEKMIVGAKVTGSQFFTDPSGYHRAAAAFQSESEREESGRNQTQIENQLKFSPFVHEDHLAFLESMEKYEAILEEPWDEMAQAFADLRSELQAKYSGSFNELRYPYTPKLLPDVADFVERADQLSIKRQVLVGAILIKRFESGEGLAPREFDQLIPKYCKELPDDPYADQPLSFKRSNDKIEISSVGPDGKLYMLGDRHSDDDIRIELPIFRSMKNKVNPNAHNSQSRESDQ